MCPRHAIFAFLGVRGASRDNRRRSSSKEGTSKRKKILSEPVGRTRNILLPSIQQQKAGLVLGLDHLFLEKYYLLLLLCSWMSGCFRGIWLWPLHLIEMSIQPKDFFKYLLQFFIMHFYFSCSIDTWQSTFHLLWQTDRNKAAILAIRFDLTNRYEWYG